MENKIPQSIIRLELPGRAGPISARKADLELIGNAPKDYLDTTHFDTVRFPPPAWAKDAIMNAVQDGSLAYTPYRGHPVVLEKLSASISMFMGTEVSTSNLILTPGTQAGLFISLSSIIEKNDRVALMSPDYLFNARILEYIGTNIGYVPIHNSSTAPRPDFEILEKEFSRHGARVLIMSNPNNPTGYVYSQRELQKIADLANKYNVTIVMDALYSRLLHDSHSYTHLASLPGMKDRVITLLGPSKTESLSGYRLGVVVAASKLLPRMENVLSIMSLRAPAYAQHLLTKWLSEDQEWIDTLIPQFTHLRDMTFKAFKQLPWIKMEPQKGTAYAWPDISALGVSDLEVAMHILKDAGVLISPGYQFGIQAPGHFRVCYARDETEWEQALGRMVQVLDKLAKSN